MSKGCGALLDFVFASVPELAARTHADARVCLASHSGGYLAVAAALRAKDLSVQGVGLLDSLYGQTDAFYEAVAGGARIANYYGPSTTTQSLALAQGLAGAGLEPGCAYQATSEFHETVPQRYLVEALDCLWG